jgi:1,2-phenylacetyl-CoA epoxidase catalytic subunit
VSDAVAAAREIERATEIPDEPRQALRDLILILADSKRLLGMRYSDCMLASPSLETGIAASSMAQDEWGHSRLTYALLSDFGDDPKRLEHERDRGEYHSMEALDRPFTSWTEMIAASLLIDTALTVQFEALLGSRYQPARNRVQKLLDEEVLHFQYAAGWAGRLGKSQVAEEFVSHVESMLPGTLRWFGPQGSRPARLLLEQGLVIASPDAVRSRLLARIAPVVQGLGIAERLNLTSSESNGWSYAGRLEWGGWDERRRRSRGEGPDEETISRVRGDRNRAMLLE